MSSAELLELPVVPKEERLCFGGRLETRRRLRSPSRLTFRDGRARTRGWSDLGRRFPKLTTSFWAQTQRYKYFSLCRNGEQMFHDSGS